jgi:hypothetical protein
MKGLPCPRTFLVHGMMNGRCLALFGELEASHWLRFKKVCIFLLLWVAFRVWHPRNRGLQVPVREASYSMHPWGALALDFYFVA